jgi:hypothetical protein
VTNNTMANRKKDKRTNNNIQNTTQKTKDWGMGNHLITRVNLGTPEG